LLNFIDVVSLTETPSRYPTTMIMRLNVTSWQHVVVYSLGITALSVAVPVIVVALTLWRLPFTIMMPALLMAGAIPLFIAFPISVFALNLLRTMNLMVARIDELVKYDGMTGLLNRTSFFLSSKEKRKGTGMLAIVDADHFKLINDRFGHDCGDRALQLLSQHLLQVFGPYGLVGRLGGEEFGVYLPKATIGQLKLLVAMLRTNLRANPLNYEGHEIHLAVSIGAATDRADEAFEQVSKLADACLYQAKAAGRDCCIFRNDVDEVVQLVA
jgi:diguanylate cyclase (GGDEF)-like protein